MADLVLFSAEQMAKIEPFFLLSHAVPRVDNRRAKVVMATITIASKAELLIQ